MTPVLRLRSDPAMVRGSRRACRPSVRTTGGPHRRRGRAPRSCCGPRRLPRR